MDDAIDGLPPLHRGWARALLDGPVPRETEATCNSCAMLVDGDPVAGFHADTKCCTYLPDLANFLVGGILADQDPDFATGRASVRERIAKRVAVTPLGLRRPRSYLLLYDEGGAQTFGRAAAMRCPHYDNGNCGVWRHREATCSTWFCKYVRGKVGREFWVALHRLLVLVEKQLAWWAVSEAGLDPQVVASLVDVAHARRAPIEASELDQRAPAHYRALWGAWVDREEELYRACAERVGNLAWSDVLAIAGGEARAIVAVVHARHAALLSETLPDRLEVGGFRIVKLAGETCRISAYSEYDAIELPAELLDVLRRFDGRPHTQVIAELEADGIEVGRDLLRRLVDLGVLAEPIIRQS